MSKYKEVSKNRILLYYLLAIVLPCIILGVLAFRGILNDQALVEKESRRNLLDLSQSISENTLSEINQLDQEILTILEKKSTPTSAFFWDSSMVAFIQDNPVAKHLYILIEDEELRILDKGLIYYQDGSIEKPFFTSSLMITEAMSRGWQYEFQEKNYNRALDHYQNILYQLKDSADIAFTMNILARLHKKNEDFDQAIETYDQLFHEYPGIYLQGNIPLGLTALREKLRILSSKKDTVNIVLVLNELLDQLIFSQWEINKSFYQNTLNEINATINEIDTIPNFVIEKVTQLARKERETEYLLKFMGASNEIVSLQRNSLRGSSSFNIRYDGEAYYFSILPDEGRKWIVLFDQNTILDSMMIPGINEKDIENAAWEIKGWQDTIVRHAGISQEFVIPVSFVFPSSLPPWTIEYFPENKGVIASFFTTSGGLYFYILIFILIVLAFGLMFTMNTINQELRLSKMKSYFISTVSHEFKSPLTSIRQMAEMLDRDRVPTEKRKKDYYSTMLHQSERLSHLIDNILDFARMEEGRKQYHFEVGDLTPVIEEVVNTFNIQVEDQGIAVSFEKIGSVPSINYDKESIEQVIHNLLDNAVKYSGDSRSVNIQLGTRKEDVYLTVTDYGIGIPKSEQDKIFNRFYRVGDELTSRIKGSGIGLTIVKQIVEAHRGHILLESKPGEGSIFTVLLPIN